MASGASSIAGQSLMCHRAIASRNTGSRSEAVLMPTTSSRPRAAINALKGRRAAFANRCKPAFTTDDGIQKWTMESQIGSDRSFALLCRAIPGLATI